jgi:aminoglycoside phosphotransferase (APT) family kinase protein
VSDAPGELIGAGRVADVFDLGDGTVLRRYRAGGRDVEREADVMRWVRERGVPVPRVHRAAERDIVMDRIDGSTMRAALDGSPWSSIRFARTLARLQAAVADVPAPDWLMAPGFAAPASGDSVLHLDLRPGNVILSAAGPVVIDWTDAAGGPAGFDAALSYVAMVTHTPDGQADRIANRVLAARFRRARGPRLVDPFVPVACDHRLADPTITPDERVAIAEYRRGLRDSARR